MQWTIRFEWMSRQQFRGSLEARPITMSSFATSRLIWLLAGLFLLASVSGRSVPAVNMGGSMRKLADTALAGQDYFNSTAADDTASKKSFFDRVGIYIVGLGCTIVLIVSISVVAVLYLRHKRRMAAVSPYWRQGMSGQLQAVLETSVPLLGREEVETACEDFSNIIGSSPDSVMYKGTLANGTEIAALSLQMAAGASWEPQSELAFRNRVKALARMKHPHLVNLVGYCSQDEPRTRIFIFEYASNGTLYDHLHNKESEHLNWAARMRVIVGAAYGLRYMHHELVPPASHVNFGADAVYLTDDYAAKVSNAGATKVPAPRTNDPQPKSSWFSLKAVAGCDDGPESSAPDLESNIFSFGLFLLEVITGRPPQHGQGPSLVHFAAEYLPDPKMMWYMVDPSLESHNHDELVALCEIVSMCLAAATDRPSMLRVTDLLSDALRLTPEMVAANSPAALWAQLELHDDTASEISLQ